MTAMATDTARLLSKCFCERFLLPAVCMGHAFVVAEILKRSQIDINGKTNYGQTALSLAAERGYTSIVTLLLARKSIDVNVQDIDGQTAIGWASFNGQAGVVSTLLKHPNIRIDLPDTDGMTPLSWAIAEKHNVIVVLLFEKLGIYPSPEFLDMALGTSSEVEPAESSLINALEARSQLCYSCQVQSLLECGDMQSRCLSLKRGKFPQLQTCTVCNAQSGLQRPKVSFDLARHLVPIRL